MIVFPSLCFCTSEHLGANLNCILTVRGLSQLLKFFSGNPKYVYVDTECLNEYSPAVPYSM